MQITENDICNQLWGRQGDPFHCPTLVGEYETSQRPDGTWITTRDGEKFSECISRWEAERAVKRDMVSRINDVLKNET